VKQLLEDAGNEESQCCITWNDRNKFPLFVCCSLPLLGLSSFLSFSFCKNFYETIFNFHSFLTSLSL
jgi:hypothetical protein